MPRSLIDLLWRDQPGAPTAGSRGPRTRVTTDAVVNAALAVADSGGLGAATIRAVAEDLGVSAMSVYTHVNSRADLNVLMADTAHAQMKHAEYGTDQGWQAHIEALAVAQRSLLMSRPWLLDIIDERTALGPGTIAKYDHDLHAFDLLNVDDVDRDAALTYVLDFVHASVRAALPSPHTGELAANWAEWNERLKKYLSSNYPLAQKVGATAGRSLGGTRTPDAAWRFGLNRVIVGLAGLEK